MDTSVQVMTDFKQRFLADINIEDVKVFCKRDEKKPINMRSLLETMFGLYVTIIDKVGDIGHISVDELMINAHKYNEGAKYDVQEWLSEVTYTSVYKNELKTLEKYNVAKQEYGMLDLTPLEVAKTLSGVSSSKDIVKDAKDELKTIKDRIRTDIRMKYIRTRNRKFPDGSLDNLLSLDEIRILDAEANDVIANDPTVRNLISMNTNFGGLHDTFKERSIDMRYKYERTKEFICNVYRVTPDSFDVFYKAILDEQYRRFNEEFEYGGEKKYTSMSQFYNLDYLTDLMVEYKHLLRTPKNDDKKTPLYISDIVKLVERDDTYKINLGMSNPMFKDNATLKEIWEGLGKGQEIRAKQIWNKIQGKDIHSGIPKQNPDNTIDVNNNAEKIMSVVSNSNKMKINIVDKSKIAPADTSKAINVKVNGRMSSSSVSKRRLPDLKDFI